MERLNENHKYSQQATKTLLFIFFSTAGIVILSAVAMVVFKIWWPVFIIGIIVLGWYLYNYKRKTVPLYDLTVRVNIIAGNKDWVVFKKEHPNQVIANGKKN